ncbi:MAG TPA: hypothetical protein VFY36_12820 [Solirubrobacteraceae bacterium]|nr:hypothetical protein [Solirubrobacteraceae bacterium]
MNPTLSYPPIPAVSAPTRHERPSISPRTPLARYADRHGNPREVVIRHGLAGSTLVVDRDAVSLGDCLLVAHLAADEPAENAVLVCRAYLEDVRARRFRCRSLSERDASTAPVPEHAEPHEALDSAVEEIEPVDSHGCSYRLERVSVGMSIPAMRWCRREPRQSHSQLQPVSLRETIANLEDYEPMCGLTEHALRRHRDDTALSTSVLGTELARVRESPIVLNRGLREVVLATLEREELSMSEIAIRCDRIKRDGRGTESGDTSWLGRRIGLLPDSGQSVPTPWIHSDVLALIARRGLAISPREVELQ